MSLERLAWVSAYIQYFHEHAPSAVLRALGVEESAFERDNRAHVRRIARAMADDDPSLAGRFARELALAKATLREQRPSLDDVRATYGEGRGAPASDVDETAMLRAYLPEVVLPFNPEARPALPPVQRAPAHVESVGPETIRIDTGSADESACVDDTLPLVTGPKGR